MKNKIHIRIFWLAIGFTSLGLGILGVVLPLLPTTPFILLAAFSFSRSSKRWHDWLINHHVFGKMITNWQTYGAINLYVKIISTVFIVGILLLSFIMAVSNTIIVIQAVILSSVLVFIWSRPLPPKDKTI